MDLYSLAIVALMSLGVLIVVALPAWIALFIAWRYEMPRSLWRSFSFTCLLLSYGFLTVAGAVLLPLEIAQVFIAPDLSENGYEKLGTAIFIASEDGVPIACLVTALISSLIVPLKLQKHWAAISSVRANNSFKPSPLRGLGPTDPASGGPA